MSAGARGVSRRGLLGAGLSRALAARQDENVPAARVATLPGAGEGDSLRLGGLLGDAADRVLEAAGLRAPGRRRVVVVAAGDGTPLVARAAGLGHPVVGVERDGDLLARGRARLPGVEWRAGRATWVPVPDATADAVLAWFGATYEPDPRGVAAELRRVAGPGAAIVLAAWTGAAMAELRGGAPRPRHRPEQWSRYETAYRHFLDCPRLDVEEHTLELTPPGGAEPVSLGYAVVAAARP